MKRTVDHAGRVSAPGANPSRVWLVVVLLAVSALWFFVPLDSLFREVVVATENSPVAGPARRRT